jgi:hypothetical protein
VSSVGTIAAAQALRLLPVACALLAFGSAHAGEGELRWRVFDQDDSALLAIADSEATDNFDSPLFQCRKTSGIAIAEGNTSEELRSTIAALILHDRVPAPSLVPDDSSAQVVEVFYSEMTGWRYRFPLSVTGPAFEQLKRTGAFQFKLNDTVVRNEFKVGLDSIAKFQEFCKPPSK